jgi:PAS domain S-box-containing protein
VSEERYRDRVENLTDVIFSLDSNGLVTYISPAFEALAGYPPAAVIGRPLTDFMHPADLSVVMMEFALAKSGAVALLERRLVDRAGGLRWICSHIRPLMIDGRFAACGVLTDITGRNAPGALHQLNLSPRSGEAPYRAARGDQPRPKAFVLVSHPFTAARAINGFSEAYGRTTRPADSAAGSAARASEPAHGAAVDAL